MSESSLNNDEEEVSNCVEVTQETPTKRWRPQTNKTPINPYSTSSKEEVKDKKIYHGWRQVIEATIQGTTLHQMETQKNVQNLATKQTKPKINKKKKGTTQNKDEENQPQLKEKISYTTALIGKANISSKNSNSNSNNSDEEKNQSIRLKFYFHALPAENETITEFIKSMLFNLMGCAKEVDSKAKLLKWKKN